MKDSIQEAYLHIVSQDQLDEGIIRNAIASAAIAGAAISGYNALKSDDVAQTQRSVVGKLEQSAKKDFNIPHDRLVSTITSKFKIDSDKANHIAQIAAKYSHPKFPQAHHILAIAGIESSFNENAKSKLKRDPAVGLMQMRPKVWGVDKSELSTIEGQIKHGAHILHQYYKKTGSIEGAVKAYNIGISNYNRGKQLDAAHRYVSKFNDEVKRYHQI